MVQFKKYTKPNQTVSSILKNWTVVVSFRTIMNQIKGLVNKFLIWNQNHAFSRTEPIVFDCTNQFSFYLSAITSLPAIFPMPCVRFAYSLINTQHHVNLCSRLHPTLLLAHVEHKTTRQALASWHECRIWGSNEKFYIDSCFFITQQNSNGM